MPIKDPVKRREYHREYNRKRYKQDPEFRKKHLDRVKKNDQKYRKQAQRLIEEFRVNGCKLCPESSYCCLSAHHLDPSLKEFS
jgi:hypothetical protein